VPNRTWNIAIVGPGWVAGAYLEVFRKRDDVRVTHVVDATTAGARAFVEQHNLDAAVHDDISGALTDKSLDIVGVYTPHHLHAPLAIAAARAGKHLIVEKPLCLNLDDLRAMRAAVRKAGVKSITGFVLRWNPLLNIIRRNVIDGTLGDIIYAEVDYLHSIVGKGYTKPWHCSRKTAGTSMLVGGCHAVDAIRFLVGQPVVEVSAVSATRTTELEYPSTEIALLRFADGSAGKVACCLECNMPYVFNAEVYGTKGTFRNNQFAGDLFKGQTGFATFPTVMPDSSDVNHHPFAGEVAEFLDALHQDRRPLPDIEDAAETIEICLACEMSSQQHRPIKLPLE
jgi:predicted dehydrogenase